MKDSKKLGVLISVTLILSVLFIVVDLNVASLVYSLPRRILKVATMLLAGATIGYSTIVFQTITNNRILTPSIMGLDSLFLLVQTLVLFLLGASSIFLINAKLNFVLTVVLMLIFSSLLFRGLFLGEQKEVYFLLLVGVVAGTLFQSIASFLQMILDPNEFLIVQKSMFASFNNIQTELLIMSFIVIGILVIYLRRYVSILDVLALGREQAINLGIDYEKVVFRLLLVVSVFVAAVTALVGPITFLGLLVANLAREYLASYKHKHILPAASLLGAIALVGGQFMLERIFNIATPVSVVINLVGGLYFVFLLIRGQRA